MVQTSANLRPHMTLSTHTIMSMRVRGGHIREIDDTPGKERIHERHATWVQGMRYTQNGTKVTRVKKDNYDLITGNTSPTLKAIIVHHSRWWCESLCQCCCELGRDEPVTIQ